MAAKSKNAKNRWSEADLLIRDQIAVVVSRSDLSFEQIATRLGITDRTLRTRRSRPETFTLLELRRLEELAESLGLTINVHLEGIA